MAITRAQQYRQMLEEGGRLGYRFGSRGYQGGASRSVERPGSSSRSSNVSPGAGNSRRNTGGSNIRDNRQQYSAKQTQTGKVKGGGKPIRDYADRIVGYEDDRPSQKAIDNAKKFQEEQKRKREEAINVLTNGGEFEGGRFSKANPPTIDPLRSEQERSAYVRDRLAEYGRELIEEYPDTFFNQIFYGILFYEVDNTRYED